MPLGFGHLDRPEVLRDAFAELRRDVLRSAEIRLRELYVAREVRLKLHGQFRFLLFAVLSVAAPERLIVGRDGLRKWLANYGTTCC